MNAAPNLDDLVRAAIAAPEERMVEALRVLRGEVPDVDDNAPQPPVEPYLTLKEVASHLGVCTGSLWLWQVPGHDLGGRRRFKISEVAAYLEGEEFKHRAAALRAQRRLSAKEAPKRPTPTTANP